MSDQLIVVTGATGNIGKKISEILLKNGRKVRVIGRSTEKLRKLVDSGAEAAVGDLADAEFLTKALQGADSIFAMVPPNLTAENFRKYQGTVSDSIVSAIRKSGLKKVVALSSLGADLAEGTGVVTGLHDFEQKLGSLEGVDILILRPSFFMENLYMGIPVIKSMGVNGSAAIGDLAYPMIATRDIADVAAEALQTGAFSGTQIRELLGPEDVSMEQATRAIGKAIGKDSLPYAQVPYETVKAGMIQAGLSEDVADGLVELNRWLNSHYGKAFPARTAESTTPTTIEEFAAEFAKVFAGEQAAHV